MTTLHTGPAAPADATRRNPPAASELRRRSTPHVVLGALLVVVCAVAFAVTALRVDPRTAVLALARPVPAGHTLSATDLAVVRIVPDAALAVVAEGQRSQVVGRTVRLPVAANTLLSQEMLGPAAWPPRGQALVAVSVKPGRAPQGLAAGLHVLVLTVPAQSGAGASRDGTAVQVPATVVSVGAADGTGASVVSLLVASPDAAPVAAAAGDVALAVQGEGG
jgi:SAF domain